MDLEVVPLHKSLKYISDCCKLINSEWKRSETARMRSLESSCDQLPTSLILLKDKKVVGHLKISSIPSLKTACFVESVVIDKNLRGQKLGSYLMKEAEDYCKKFLCLDTIYLSTKGQEEFYRKLGYVECLPISIYGNACPTEVAREVIISSTETIEKSFSPPPPPLPINNNNNGITFTTKTFMKKDI